jgi:hypothetical protein
LLFKQRTRPSAEPGSLNEARFFKLPPRQVPHSSSVRESRRTRGGKGARRRTRWCGATERGSTRANAHRIDQTPSPHHRSIPKVSAATGLAPRGTLGRVAVFPFRKATGRPNRAIAAMTPADRKTHPLVFSCPNTGLPLITHILTQSGDAPAIQAMRFTVRCACCRAAHELDGADCRNNRPRRWRHLAPALSKGA